MLLNTLNEDNFILHFFLLNTEVAIIQEQLAILSKHHVRETNMVDPYGDTGKYTGQVQNDKPHGKGTMKYDDGRVYVGTYQRYVSSICSHKILLTDAFLLAAAFPRFSIRLLHKIFVSY